MKLKTSPTAISVCHSSSGELSITNVNGFLKFVDDTMAAFDRLHEMEMKCRMLSGLLTHVFLDCSDDFTIQHSSSSEFQQQANFLNMLDSDTVFAISPFLAEPGDGIILIDYPIILNGMRYDLSVGKWFDLKNMARFMVVLKQKREG